MTKLLLWKIHFLNVLLTLVCVTSKSQYSTNCTGNQKIKLFKERILICGDTETDGREKKLLISNFTIKDCKTDKVLIDNSDDAITKYFLRDCNDSLMIIETVLLPDTSMTAYILAPLSQRVLKVEKGNNKVFVGPEKYCFKSIGLTSKQKQIISGLCDSVDLKIKNKDSNFYPFNEHDIYSLFLGAINNNARSIYLYKNLTKFFQMDGSLSETIGEIPYEYIMEHRQRVSTHH